MSNTQGFFLGTRNWVEEEGVTFTPETATIGDNSAGNVAYTNSDDVWRINGIEVADTSEQLVIDLAQDRQIDILSIFWPRSDYPGVNENNPNIATTDTLRVELLDAADVVLWDSTVYNPTDVDPNYMVHFLDISELTSVANRTARKVRITFDLPSRTTETFSDVEYIGLWTKFSPQVGLAYPAGYGWVLPTEIQEAPSGRRYTSGFEPFRRWSMVFDQISTDDGLTFDEMVRRNGRTFPIFVKRGDLPAGKNAMIAVIDSPGENEFVTPEELERTITVLEFI
jgi:hypothetical protein